MELFRYTFHLKHDDGIVKISTNASNIKAAIHMVLEAEGAPERAIHKIIIQPLKEKK